MNEKLSIELILSNMNCNFKKISRKTLAAYCISLSLSLVFTILVMELWKADIRVPFCYLWDGQLNGMCIKGAIDNGWFLHNKYVGMPTGLYMHDFPFVNNIDIIFMKLISYFTKDYGLTENIFFLLTFPLTTFTSMLAFRQFKISYSSSILGSLIYTFVPYHFLRGELHLFLSTYYLIPLIVIVILWVYEDNEIVFDKNFRLNILNLKFLVSIFVCFLMGAGNIYYAFFSCYFLMVSGLILFLSKKDIRPLLTSIFFVGLVTLSVFINNLPTIIYQHNMGSNLAIISRSPQEAEIYGLTVIQLFLPLVGHRVSFLSNLSLRYNSISPLVSDNSTESLGIIGSLGFAFLLLWVLYRTIENHPELHKVEPKFNALSVLNLSAVLLGTIGSFGSIFAYFISPQIRAYNRISIYIAFFSVFAVVLLLDLARKRLNKGKNLKIFYYSFIILLLFGGILDQTNQSIVPSYSLNEKEFYNDENFIKKIEATMPQNAMVFQLPYISFPEYPPQNNMSDYDLFKGYLHSDSLRWSYGAVKGREGDNWQQSVSYIPTEEMVERLSLAGFSGIYVDSYGYKDSGSEIISNLSKVLMTSPLKSENGRLYFFDMTLYNSQLKSRLTAEEEVEKTIVSNSYFGTGLYNMEQYLDNYWRWSSNKAVVYINNPYDYNTSVHVETTFFTGYDKLSNISVDSEYFSDSFSTNQSGYFYSKDFVLPPGTHPIYITCDAPQVYAPNDPRFMVFRVGNFKVGKYIL